MRRDWKVAPCDCNVLHLDGVDWRHAPPSWSLDHMTLTVSSDGGSFAGTYTCDTCSSTQDLSGDRT